MVLNHAPKKKTTTYNDQSNNQKVNSVQSRSRSIASALGAIFEFRTRYYFIFEMAFIWPSGRIRTDRVTGYRYSLY